MFHINTKTMIIVALVSVAPLVCYAQELPDITREVVELNNASPEVVRGALNTYTSLSSVVWAENPTRIELVGDERSVKKALGIIEMLDKGPALGKHTFLTRLIPVETYPIMELAGVIKNSVQNKNLRMGVDYVQNSLVVTGTIDQINAIEQVVAQLDIPRKRLNIQMFFIQGDNEGSTTKDLPAALKPIAKTLAANGFGSPSKIESFTTSAVSDQEFSQRSATRNQIDDTQTEETEYQFTGSGQLAMVAGEVKLQIKAVINSKIYFENQDPSQPPRPNRSEYSVDTTLTAELGQYVLLAAAPFTSGDGEAIAMVVRVTAADTQ